MGFTPPDEEDSNSVPLGIAVAMEELPYGGGKLSIMSKNSLTCRSTDVL